jgi:hypothetical protein
VYSASTLLVVFSTGLAAADRREAVVDLRKDSGKIARTGLFLGVLTELRPECAINIGKHPEISG